MKRLSFVTRMLLSTIAFALPIIVLIYQMYSAKSVNIDFSVQEEYGNAYQRPLEDIFEQVARHRILSQRVLNGDTTSEAALADVGAKVDAAFGKLGPINKQYGEVLQFTDEGLGKRKRADFSYEKVLAKWNGLKGRNKDLKPEESLAAHAEVIAGIRTMIAHAGDTSNLVLDPDLDSYYLMDVTLLALPQMQDHIQDVIVNVEPMVRRGQVTEEEKIKLAVYAFMLKDTNLVRIVGGYDTSRNEDANFYGVSETLHANLPPAMAAHQKDVEALVAMVVDLSKGKSVEADKFVAAGDAALSSSFSFWWKAVDELDVLLEKRIHVLRADRTWAIGLALGWLVIAALFSSYVGYTLRVSVRGILNSVGLLRDAAEATATTGTELVDNSQKVSSATAEQASAIQETVATLNEIDAMVGRSVDNATRSSEVARASHDVATEGKRAVEDMMQSMEDINTSNQTIMSAVNQSNEKISEITKVISEIATKTKVINDIVFQTKLLSFNASVEAARAGEHGKGFAVVAEEVGNLAQMSGSAAKEIDTMLSESISRVETIVVDTKRTVEALITSGRAKVESGTVIARRCGDVLEDIVRNVSEVNAMMDQIATAQREQAQGVSQISSAMTELDTSTQQNSESADQTSASAEMLAQQAKSLRELVDLMEAEILGRKQQRAMQPANVVPLRHDSSDEEDVAAA